MKASNFVENLNTVKEFYFVIKEVWAVDNTNTEFIFGDPLQTTVLPDIYLTQEEARNAFADLQSQKPDFGEYFELNLVSGVIAPEEIKDITVKSVDDLLTVVQQNDSINYIETAMIDYKYEDIKGYILVFWEWCQHIGYSRKCREVRYAFLGEKSDLCIPVDEVVTPQCSILCTAEELKGKDKQEICQLVHKRIDESHWKWRNDAHEVANVNFAIEQERKIGRRM